MSRGINIGLKKGGEKNMKPQGKILLYFTFIFLLTAGYNNSAAGQSLP